MGTFYQKPAWKEQEYDRDDEKPDGAAAKMEGLMIQNSVTAAKDQTHAPQPNSRARLAHTDARGSLSKDEIRQMAEEVTGLQSCVLTVRNSCFIPIMIMARVDERKVGKTQIAREFYVSVDG